ncbi:MAG: hypothetical protein ABJQ29_10010 [Luteolibacter sp.]
MCARNFLLLFLSCLTVTMLSAQEPEDDAPQVDPAHLPGLPPAKEGDIQCRCITTFMLGNRETYFFKIGSTYHEVELVSEGISQTFPVSGSTTFTLYKKAPPTKELPDEEKSLYVPVVQQELKGGGKDFFIILSRKDDKSPMKTRAINISKANCPADSIHLYNFSPLALGMEIEDSKGVLEPYKNFRYPFGNAASRNTYTTAKIVMRYKGEDKVMASTRLRLVPGRRMILFCFPSESRASLGATPLRMITYQDKP